MMKIIKSFTLSIIFLNLIICPCYAGESMSAGTALKEDSYVFTIEEAQRLKITMEELERETAKQKELVEELKKLDLVHQTKENEFEKILKSEKEQKETYKELYSSSYERVQKLEKRRTVENIGLIGAGIVTTIGLILVADAIDDHIDGLPAYNKASTQRSLIQLKF